MKGLGCHKQLPNLPPPPNFGDWCASHGVQSLHAETLLFVLRLRQHRIYFWSMVSKRWNPAYTYAGFHRFETIDQKLIGFGNKKKIMSARPGV